MASSATGSAKGPSTGFMSEYMSDLSQSQDINSFLQKNKPTYDPSAASTTPSTSSSSSTTSFPTTNHTTTSKDDKSSTSTSSADSSKKPFDNRTQAGSHPLPMGHTVAQKHAIQTAAMDNCADLNAELTDCLLGKAGTWWDRASMCMKQKEKFGKCCRLNKEALIEKRYAREGNTPEQDRAILDSADVYAQRAMKEEDTKK
ncbi:hypothetical protein BGZ83_011561 [Gryganskiella cystojenkinii]|nr:hypothetical protein BGZ83_011561 [Gryganskiella cystojenkinii]